MITDKSAFEFEWDKGNIDKNKKHGVENVECEEIFADENKIIYKDIFHSENEDRYIVIGKSRKEKLLYVVFTKRGEEIRIISCRKVNKKEVPIYEKAA